MTRSQLRHTVVREDLQAVFANGNVEGAFALLEVSTNQLTVVNRVRAEQRAVPASTFKIPHAVIALETGAIGDEDEVVPYGGGRQPVKAWERDMSIREAIPLSHAAIFQELARRIGHRREARPTGLWQPPDGRDDRPLLAPSRSHLSNRSTFCLTLRASSFRPRPRLSRR
jgi:beta-lactamase class D